MILRRLLFPAIVCALGCSDPDMHSSEGDAAVRGADLSGALPVDLALPDAALDLSLDVDASAPPSAPKPAADVGYTMRTFDSTKLGTTAGTWQPFNYFGVKQPAGSAVQNADGSLSLPGTSGDSYNATLCTAAAASTLPAKFRGIAFGGGGYFEATLSFVGTPDGHDTSPAFWADDVEHSSGYLPETKGHTWIEIDDFESDVASDTKWGQSVHNWYNDGAANVAANPPAILAGNPVEVPNGGTFDTSHTYAFLWVPATATTQGYVKFYCDGVQIGGTASYDKYDPAQAFPPSGANIGNVLDTLHLYLILGSASTKYPAIVTSVQVWQASNASNLSY
jgi:hypothetical protein